MDFNYFYARRGQSLMSADRAACDASRAAHADLAARYLRIIDAGKSGHLQAAG